MDGSFPFLEKIQELGYCIEFAYSRTANPESYAEDRHFSIALLKNKTDDTYYLKYYICKWRESSSLAEDRILLSCKRKASLLAERANQIYPIHVHQASGLDGYMCYFYQRSGRMYSWWVACPDEWVEFENVVKELINDIPYPSPLHKTRFIAVSQEQFCGI